MGGSGTSEPGPARVHASFVKRSCFCFALLATSAIHCLRSLLEIRFLSRKVRGGTGFYSVHLSKSREGEKAHFPYLSGLLQVKLVDNIA